MSGHTVGELGPDTWDAFAELVERNGGISADGTTRIRRPIRTGGSPASTSTSAIGAIPEVTEGRAAHGRFLFSATVELFEQYGFERVRQVGKHAWIVGRVVDAQR